MLLRPDLSTDFNLFAVLSVKILFFGFDTTSFQFLF